VHPNESKSHQHGKTEKIALVHHVLLVFREELLRRTNWRPKLKQAILDGG